MNVFIEKMFVTTRLYVMVTSWASWCGRFFYARIFYSLKVNVDFYSGTFDGLNVNVDERFLKKTVCNYKVICFSNV